jgi:L-ascorbate metabolism protein UlaG (beta-lactamase superfamily)
MTRLTWLGHSSVLLEIGGLRVLTDPVLGPGIGPIRRRVGPVEIDLAAVDVVLISHLHRDHLDLPSLKLLPPAVRMVAPVGAGALLRTTGHEQITELEPGQATIDGGLTINAVRAVHDGRRRPIGSGPPALGFRIEADQSIYFAGDTDIFPEMAELAPGLDLALLPVGGWGLTLGSGHMDPVRAAEALTLLRPTTAIAIHWGTLWPVGLSRVRRELFEEPARRFAEEARRVAPLVSIPFLDPGDQFELP